MGVDGISMKVYVDWDDDASFADAGSDISADVLNVSWSRGRSHVNDKFGMGTATIEVLNSSGEYSPFDSGSSLFGSMIPGRRVYIAPEFSATPYPHFFGRLANIRQSRTPDGRPTTVLGCEDEFGRLSRERYRSSTNAALTTDNLNVRTRILQVLTEANMGHSTSLIGATAQLTRPFTFHGGSVLEALQALAHQDLGGAFYIAPSHSGGAWLPVLRPRRYRSEQAVHATFTGVQALDMEIPQSDWIDRVIHRRAGLNIATEEEPIYVHYPAGYELAPGSTDPRNYIAGEYSGGATDVQTPTAVTDYLANALADGTGADVTAFVTPSFTSYGGGFEVTWNNTSGAAAYLFFNSNTAFQIRGKLVRQDSQAREITVSDASAPVRNQVLRDTFDFNDDVTSIKGYAQFRLYAGTQFYPRRLKALFIPRNDTERANILGFDLLKRIHITNTSGLYPTQIDEDYFIEGLQAAYTAGEGLRVTCDLWHEVAAIGNFFRISGASGGGADYSTISADGATVGDPVGY